MLNYIILSFFSLSPMNQFISTAIAEKMSALKTYDYLEEKAKDGSISHLTTMLAKVPSIKPMPNDFETP